MKRLIVFGVIFSLMVFNSPQAIGEVYMDFDFADGVLWHRGGFESYDILMRGEKVGTARVDYSQMTMLDATAYRVEWEQTWTDLDGTENHITSDSKMRASDLKVYMSTRIVTIDEDEWRFEGNYTGDSLVFGAYLPGVTNRQESSLTRSGRYCDADILPFLLRNIPYEIGNFITLMVVDVQTHSFITPIAKVTGSEIVETANTQYDCWVVTASLGRDAFTAWYSKNEEHYLVRIRFADRDIVLNHHS